MASVSSRAAVDSEFSGCCAFTPTGVQNVWALCEGGQCFVSMGRMLHVSYCV